MDFSPRAIGEARRRAEQAGRRVNFRCCSIFDAEFTDGSYDLVYDSGCFHHLPPHRRKTYVEFVHRALKPLGSYGLVCFRPEGGSGFTDQQVYERANMGGGLGYTEDCLRVLWDKPPFSVRVLRQMNKTDGQGASFGEDFLWTLLAAKDGVTNRRNWRLDHRVHPQALLGAAVTNNALWCDTVCRSHGYPGVFSDRLWINADHGLDFYPNAITLYPDVTAAEIASVRDLSRRYAVKDSFALLDLVPDGFQLLFGAEWIARTPAPAEPGQPGLSWGTVTDAGELGRWEAAWAQGDTVGGPLFRPELLADPRCAILACRRDGDLIAGIIAYTAAGVTGLSNLFGAGFCARQLWASAMQAVTALRPHLPIVGYEHGIDLVAARQAGCQALGPLRVWARDPVLVSASAWPA